MGGRGLSHRKNVLRRDYGMGRLCVYEGKQGTEWIGMEVFDAICLTKDFETLAYGRTT